MSTLFLDTTYEVSIGLLDESLSWKAWQRFEGQKASRTLQKETHNLLATAGVSPQDITQIITVAGPGFYTGLRLSEGFADVFSFFNIPHYSFYTYDIPKLLGHQEGSWFTKAYRGEYFFYDWKGEHQSISLVTSTDLEESIKQRQNIFIHSGKALDEKSLILLKSPISTIELLEKSPKLVFEQILSRKAKVESYYFRAPEDEFRTST